jgi:hypothetical protein
VPLIGSGLAALAPERVARLARRYRARIEVVEAGIAITEPSVRIARRAAAVAGEDARRRRGSSRGGAVAWLGTLWRV